MSKLDAHPRRSAGTAESTAGESLHHDKFRFLADIADDPMSLINRDYVYEAVNRAYCDYSRKSQKEIVGYTMAEVWGEEIFEKYIKPNMDAGFAGKVMRYEASFEFQGNGESEPKYYDVVYYPYFGPDDVVTHVAVISRDITLRKKAELELLHAREELEIRVMERTRELSRTNISLHKQIDERKLAEALLKKSEENYRELVENAQNIIMRVSPEGSITFFNEYGQSVFNLKPHHILGKRLNETIFAERDTAEFQNSFPLTDILADPEGLACVETDHTLPDGQRIRLSWTNKLIRDEHGVIRHLLSIGTDITRRRQTELALERAKAQAESASKAKSEFLANMSHEIRTPLNGIIGMTELAMDMKTDPEMHEMLRTVQSEADALLGIIDEILDFSKIEAGKMELESIPFDLGYLMDDFASGFAYRAQQKGLDFFVFLPPDAPMKLIGDPGRLRQILVNLTGNALKFTEQGQITIRIELLETATSGEDRVKYKFSVADTGIGIPKKKQNVIFESFTQVDGSAARKYGGTGLGTSISKSFVHMMNGEIGLESEVGAGSTFWFTAEFLPAPAGELEEPAPNLDLSGIKTLVVDDNPTGRELIRIHLTARGAKVEEARDAAAALDIVRAASENNPPYELIVTDIQMPHMDGFELVRKLRELPQTKDTPIMVLTSMGSPGDVKTCREAGVDGYLSRPVKRSALLETVAMILRRRRNTQQAAAGHPITQHSLLRPVAAKGRILLAEDHPTNRQMAVRHLTRAGHTVDEAENGRIAVDLFGRNAYDLVLMDIQMPEMDGYEAVEHIRSLETKASAGRTPIIAVTAHALKGYRERCLQAGMDDYLTKPMKREELLSMVDKWMKPEAGHADEELPTDSVQSLSETTSEAAPGPEEQTPASQQEEIFPLDYPRAVQEFEDDEEFLLEVLQGFIEHFYTQRANMDTALQAEDTETLRREAHSVKGGSANLTAADLSAAALALENAAKEERFADAPQLLTVLDAEFERLRRFVETKQQ